MNTTKTFIAIITIALAGTALYCAFFHDTTHTTQVIAHRGYWDIQGGAQNSIASLRAAQQAGVYGSEFDVHFTADDRLIVIHDRNHDTISDVRNATYTAIKKIPLPNGEIVPLLSHYLDEGAKDKNMKLILEIKTALTPERETLMVEKIIAMVAEKNLQQQVEYIAFSLHTCQEMVRLNPSASIAYLNGDITPTQAHEYGFTGIDYHYSKIEEHPEWVEEAHRNNITVNVWTVNDEQDIINAIDHGVDFITTDAPETVQKLIDTL